MIWTIKKLSFNEGVITTRYLFIIFYSDVVHKRCLSEKRASDIELG